MEEARSDQEEDSEYDSELEQLHDWLSTGKARILKAYYEPDDEDL